MDDRMLFKSWVELKLLSAIIERPETELKLVPEHANLTLQKQREIFTL